MISINITQNIAATPSQISEVLLEHEQLNRFFNADFQLIKKQNEGEIAGGKGAVRQVSMLGIKFKEQIISADNQHISYQIMGNKPVAEHRGDIYFYEDNNTVTPMTQVNYKISCKAPWWLSSFVLGFFIKKDIAQALNKLANNFKSGAV
ncbi:MAG: SRPBCC family protein [Colwellia sp.]|nr:SRPBCC family protein [Colwellia sp.]